MHAPVGYENQPVGNEYPLTGDEHPPEWGKGGKGDEGWGEAICKMWYSSKKIFLLIE